ncbi:MAG: hypothetical protein LR015_14365 [Verrucomicrobia bacterium]|nr:hypothetical protein [Verrucomicrobiota bacterium]
MKSPALGFTLDSFVIQAGDPETEFNLGSVFTLRGISIGAQNVAYDATTDEVQGTISFSAAFAELLPGNTTFTTTVTGLSGQYDFDSATQRGELVLSVDTLVVAFSDLLRIEGENISVTPDRAVIVEVGSLSATVPALNAGATVTGLRITSTGNFTVTSISVETEGLAETIGIGSFLPFDINTIQVVFPDADGDGRFSLDTFELGVTGSFNFDNFGSLPFTPIIQIGSDSFADNSNTFSFTLTVSDGAIAPKDLGPIQIGFSDLNIADTVIFGGTIILGGYQDGQWVPTFGGTISLQTGGKISNFSGEVNVAVIGSFDPENGILDISANLTVSFEFQDLITVTDAQLGLNLTISADGDFIFNVQRLELESASIGLIRFTIGNIVTLEATDAVLNFNPGPGQNIAEIGSLTVTLDGLGGISGSAQNFGISADVK